MDASKSFFRPGGTMDPSAPSYIERQADADLFAALSSGEYVFVLDSRQKGKSSLVARAMVKLRERGIRTVKLDLQRIGANVTTEQWYAGLLSEIGDELVLSDEVFAYWRDQQAVGPLARWIGALRDVVLPKLDVPLVVFIDEVDFVRALPFATDEFFAAIRDCFNRRSEAKGFERLTFCLVGVATPGQLIRNPEITPFNIGRRIDLADFEVEDTNSYEKKLDGPNRDGTKLMARVHYWLNGHPYLTQLLCSHIEANDWVHTKRDVDTLVRRIFLTPEGRQREPNFADVERRLLDPDVPGLSPEERRIQVLELYGKLLKGQRIETREENPIVATLRLAGVGLEDRRALALRNRLYRMVFDERWRRSSLPDAELRRQRGAARVALLRTATVAGVIVLGVTSLAVNRNWLAYDREQALRELKQQSGELERVSDERARTLENLQQRAKEVSQLSEERARSLAEIDLRNQELLRLSGLRAASLRELEVKNRELERVSEGRRDALTNLERTSAALSESSYNGMMNAMGLALSKNQLMRAATFLDRARDYPNKGWEWGHASLRLGEYVYEQQLDPDSRLAIDQRGRLIAHSPRRAVHVTPASATHAEVALKGHYFDIQVGRFQVLRPLAQYVNVVRDEETGKIVSGPKPLLRVWDVLPEANMILWSESGSNGPVLYSRHLDTLKDTTLVSGEGFTTGAKFLHDGSIISLHQSRKLIRWDTKGTQQHMLEMRDLWPNWGNHLTISPDRRHFFAWNWDPRRLELRSTEDLNIIRTFDGPEIRPYAMAFSPKGDRIVVGTLDGVVRVYDVASGKLLASLAGHRTSVKDVHFVADSYHVASIDDRSVLRVSKIGLRAAIRSYPTGELDIRGTSLPDNESAVYGITIDGKLFSRDNANGQVYRRSLGGTLMRTVRSVHGQVYVGLADGTIEKLSVPTLKVEDKWKISSKAVTWLNEFPLSQRWVVACSDASEVEVHLLNFADLRSITRLKVPEDLKAQMPMKITGSVAGKYVLLAYDEGSLLFYATEDGKFMRRLDLGRSLWDLVTADKGTTVIAAFTGGDNPAHCDIVKIDPTTGKVQNKLPFPSTPLGHLHVSPESRYLVAVTGLGSAYFWDLKSNKVMYEVFPGARTFAVSFSPDLTRFTLSNLGASATLHDLKSGEQLFTFDYEPIKSDRPPSPNYGDRATFIKGGKKVKVDCLDGVIRVFDSQPWHTPKTKPAAGTPRKPAP